MADKKQSEPLVQRRRSTGTDVSPRIHQHGFPRRLRFDSEMQDDSFSSGQSNQISFNVDIAAETGYQEAQNARPQASPAINALRGNINPVPELDENQDEEPLADPIALPNLYVTTPEKEDVPVDAEIHRKSQKPGTEGSSTISDYGWSNTLRDKSVGTLTPETQDRLADTTGLVFYGQPEAQPSSIAELDPLDLRRELRKKSIEHPDEEKGFFVPLDALMDLVTPESVIAELQRSKLDSPTNRKSLEKVSDYVCKKHQLKTGTSSEEKYTSGRKLFAILVLIQKPEFITQFMTEGLRDKDLPFKLKLEPKGGGVQLLRKDEPYHPIQAFHTWRDIDIETFEKYQWYLLSPIFSKADKAHKVFHYPLQTKVLLPFVESGERSITNPQWGGFGTVFKVKIHPSHHSFDKPEGKDLYFAVKRLISPNEADFHQEVETLKKFSINSHQHLIKLLATYQHAGSYHLIFPWADGNLRQLWKSNPDPAIDKSLAFWTADQCHGLAVGLNKIHHYQSSSDPQNLSPDSSRKRPYGRHSDIKPENILWFRDHEGHEAFSGVLKISDFGLTQFNSRNSRSQMPAREMARTPTYRPPECDLPETKISQAWDMWTLGCLYLEFITWLVKGSDAVNDAFVEERIHDGSNEELRELKEDTFFVIEQGAASLKPSVLHWIDNLHNESKCTAYLHDLLDFVLESLLNPSPHRRAKCPDVVEKLASMRNRCRKDENYGVTGVPRPVTSTPPLHYKGQRPQVTPPIPLGIFMERIYSSPTSSIDSSQSLPSVPDSHKRATHPKSPQDRISIEIQDEQKCDLTAVPENEVLKTDNFEALLEIATPLSHDVPSRFTEPGSLKQSNAMKHEDSEERANASSENSNKADRGETSRLAVSSNRHRPVSPADNASNSHVEEKSESRQSNESQLVEGKKHHNMLGCLGCLRGLWGSTRKQKKR